jgi:hypothetical protein
MRIVATVLDTLEAEASRQTAHIFLDVAAIHDGEDVSDLEARDAMTGVALQRLLDVGSILLTQDDDTGQITLDIARAGTGIVAVIVACLDGWAASAGVNRSELIAEVRTIVDQHLVEGADG